MSALETPLDILSHEVSSDAARSFIAWRKATKKPLTERAALMVVKTLREITGQGGDADEALDLAQEHGWQTIKPHWYWRIKNDGNRNAVCGPDGGTKARKRPDPAIENALRLAGIEAPSGDTGY